MPAIQRFYAHANVGDPPQITVTFDASTSPPTWTISPDSLEMHGNGVIQFVLSGSSSSGARFTGFGIKATSPNPNDGTFDNVNVVQNGQRMNVNDNDDVPVGGMPKEYDYLVTVSYGGTTYSSDPKIINDPPPEAYRMVPVRAASETKA